MDDQNNRRLPISKRLIHIVNGTTPDRLPNHQSLLPIYSDTQAFNSMPNLEPPVSQLRLEYTQNTAYIHLNTQLEHARLRESKLKRAVYALELEFGRNHSHTLGFNKAMSEVAQLHDALETLSQQLINEEERNVELEQSRRAMDAEYESLSATLFDSANNMVREQSMRRADAERRAYMTETRLSDAEQVIESLRSELRSLKQMLTEQQDPHVLVSIPSTPVLNDEIKVLQHQQQQPVTPMSAISNGSNHADVSCSGKEWYTDQVPITFSSPRNLNHLHSCTTSPTSRSDRNLHPNGFIDPNTVPFNQVIPELYPCVATEFHSFLNVLFAKTGPNTQYLTSIDRENSLYRTKFMELLFEQDVKPTLALPALSWLQKKTLAGTVSSNSLAIMLRRTPMLATCPKPSSSSPHSALRSAAKSFLPVFNIPTLSNPQPVPTLNLDTRPVTDVNLQYTPETINCWGCATAVINIPPLFVLTLTDADSLKLVCQFCKEKLVAVCQLFSYIRQLSAGHVPKRLSALDTRSTDPSPVCLEKVLNRQESAVPSTRSLFLNKLSSVTANLTRRYSGNLTSNNEPQSAFDTNDACEIPTDQPVSTKPIIDTDELESSSHNIVLESGTPISASPILDGGLIIEMTPDFVAALWFDFCKLRQRMFLARLGIANPGNGHAFDTHSVVQKTLMPLSSPLPIQL